MPIDPNVQFGTQTFTSPVITDPFSELLKRRREKINGIQTTQPSVTPAPVTPPAPIPTPISTPTPSVTQPPKQPQIVQTTGGVPGTISPTGQFIPTTPAPAPIAAPTTAPIPPPTPAPSLVPEPVPTPTFQEDVQNILKQYGITPSTTVSPLVNFADYYRQTLQGLGIPDIKAQFDVINKQFTDLQNEQTDRIAKINSNPWLSGPDKAEASNLIRGKYEGRLSNLTNQLRLYESLFRQGQEEARFVAQQALSQFHRGQQLQEQLVLKAIDIAEKQMEARKPIKLAPGQELVDPETGRVITQAPPRKKEGEKITEISGIEIRLRASTGRDGFVDPKVYSEERRRSNLSPTAFDQRFANLLSPQEQRNLNITGVGKGTARQFLNPDFFIGQGMKPKDAQKIMPIIQSWRNAGFTDDEINKLLRRKKR